jgi:hypothetical protein
MFFLPEMFSYKYKIIKITIFIIKGSFEILFIYTYILYLILFFNLGFNYYYIHITICISYITIYIRIYEVSLCKPCDIHYSTKTL